jgi:hypothetical protein
MGMWSNAGSVIVWNVASPKFADLAVGYAYSVILSNQTNADITTGTFTFEGADQSAADHCVPGTFAALQVFPACDALPGAVTGPATITLTPASPIRAGQQCAFAIECPKQFLRVVGTPGGLDIMAVVTRLRRASFGQAAA